MQHGTGREYLIDLLENAQAITTQDEVRHALSYALGALQGSWDLDERGRFGPDYGAPRVTKAERDEAFVVVRRLEYREPYADEGPA